jgi:hypothetical protein
MAWPTTEATATPGEAETEAEFIARRDTQIQTWLKTKKDAAVYTELEKSARSTVSKTLFPNPTKGTNRVQLGNGYAVKLTYVLNYKLGDKDKIGEDGAKVSIVEQVNRLEAAIIEKHGLAGQVIVDRLITWKPEISGSEYEKLNKDSNVENDIAVMISEHLTITPAATPTLVFEEPKP